MGPVNEVLVLPPCEGINADQSDTGALNDFIDHIRGRQFDLALQAFGGGQFSNPLVRRFGARVSIGFRAADAPALDQNLFFGELQNRRLQLLELAALAGAPAACLETPLSLTAADTAEAAQVLAASAVPLALIQPGASDPRRRWPERKFARVADTLAASGMRIAVNGTLEERAIAHSVVSLMHHDAVDLSGRLSLGGLCALIQRSALMISNDTGPLHLATALGTPAVGIYWLSNLPESQPLCQQAHRAAWATATACPVCGLDNLRQRCSHQASFVDQVSVDEVSSLAAELMQTRPR